MLSQQGTARSASCDEEEADGLVDIAETVSLVPSSREQPRRTFLLIEAALTWSTTLCCESILRLKLCKRWYYPYFVLHDSQRSAGPSWRVASAASWKAGAGSAAPASCRRRHAHEEHPLSSIRKQPE